MFQRLKGAIDTRIAEEQARQRQATQTNTTKPSARRRPENQDAVPARSPARLRESILTGKGPDPKEFEAELVDDEVVVTSETTIAAESETGEAGKQGDRNGATENSVVEDKPESTPESVERRPEDNIGSPVPSDTVPELPTEVRVKLRKLDRLESKYGELLKAYRAAHARVQLIETFETLLKENTPLTSISDPTALVEYLNQVKLKGDMVLDEFKKVSAERDVYKKKQEQLEADNKSLHTEVEELKSKVAGLAPSGDDQNGEPRLHHAPALEPSKAGNKDETDSEHATKSSLSSSSRIPSISLFSPRLGSKKEEVKDVSEDLFSYDSELPRLESELQQRTAEVDTLNKQVLALQNDLKVARESTEGMVQTLETTTDELNNLRDANDKFETLKSDLQKRVADAAKVKEEDASQVEKLQLVIQELHKERAEAFASSEELKKQIHILENTKSELQTQITNQKANTDNINEELSQKDQVVKDLENSLAMAKRAEREQAEGQVSSEKRTTTMQGIIDSVRSQLTVAEKAVFDLTREIETKDTEFVNRPSSKVFGFLDEGMAKDVEALETREDAVNYLVNIFGLPKPNPDAQDVLSAPAQSAVSESVAGGTGKKKNNKKKKKNGKVTQPAVEVSEPAQVTDEQSLGSVGQAAAMMQDLRQSYDELLEEIDEKAETIERLNGKLKDQDELREEIEILRDDLLHQGEEHVEARDALKTATEERKALQTRAAEMGTELEEARKQLAASAERERSHDELNLNFEELKTRFAVMEKDLKAAEQLAAARFKDISDLKDLLTKAQPELRSLRSEVAELSTTRNDFKNKQGELNRLEAKHEDLKAEMKGLARRLSEKDSDIKTLQEKIEQESKARSRVEIELTSTKSELKVAESRRAEAQELSSQLTQNLATSKEEASSLRSRLRDLEEQLAKQTRETSTLREEISLKVALHTSSQSLVQSLRDQTHELSTQAREASSRAESLEEELAETQRMLSERTREGSTMRMLLNQAESGTEARLREMKERMDAAIEERDRIEDEASVSSRRVMRELEDAKNKARDALRRYTTLEDERDELIDKTREWRRRREELEQATESASREVEDIQAAMKGLREALNESERQVREAETQKLDLRRQSEEANERVEKLTRANKNLADEIKNIQSGVIRKGSVRPAGSADSGLQSSRTSIDSSSARSPASVVARAMSRTDTPTNASSTASTTSSHPGLSQGTVDYVYLKNVLLQFMERKDKSHQRQLIPVLGMLLHFDRTDEQKWMSAISTRG